MKYVVILGDGMADYPVDAFDGKTILEVADKPTIDRTISEFIRNFRRPSLQSTIWHSMARWVWLRLFKTV